eukprot:4774301-Pleurochrysis_carterae.AAC.1
MKHAPRPSDGHYCHGSLPFSRQSSFRASLVSSIVLHPRVDPIPLEASVALDPAQRVRVLEGALRALARHVGFAVAARVDVCRLGQILNIGRQPRAAALVHAEQANDEHEAR